MGRPPGEGRSEKLSEPVYVRIRKPHHDLVRKLSAEEERDVATILRRCFERGFAQMYPDLAAEALTSRVVAKRRTRS